MTAPYADRGWHRGHCPEAGQRELLNDDEFWAHVGRNLGTLSDLVDVADEVDQDQLDSLAPEEQPCPVCGSRTACAYDADGQALIHTTHEADL